jgi:hypothetical protein
MLLQEIRQSLRFVVRNLASATTGTSSGLGGATDTSLTGTDRRVLGVCLLAAVAITLFFGLAPAWRSARTGLASTLKSGATSAGAHPRTIGLNVLVVS